MEIPSELFSVAVVPFIILLVQIFKTAFPSFNSKFAPLIALVGGCAFAYGHAFSTGQIDWITATIWAFFYALSAIGAYSGVKNVAQGISQ